MSLLCTIRKGLAGLVGAAWVALWLSAPMALAQIGTEPMPLPEGIVATGDTLEVRALHTWAEEHMHNNPQEAEQVTQRALTLARELGDIRGIGLSLMTLGRLTTMTDPYQAEVFYKGAIEAFEQIGDERSLARSQINLATAYEVRGELRQALTYFFEVLDKLEELQDDQAQAVILINIGHIFSTRGDVNDALAYLERANTVVESLDDPYLVISTSINLGRTLAQTGAYERAEMVFNRALTIAEEQEEPYYIMVSSHNLGVLFNDQGLYESALPYLLTAERWGKELGEDLILVAGWTGLGEAYLGLGEYSHALHYAHEGLTLAREMGWVSRLMTAHETLSRIYEAVGDHEQALAHYRQYAVAKDSVFTAERAEIISEMQTRYETEEQRRVNERLAQQNRIQALQLTLLLAGVGGLLLILGVVYYRYRLKQRANRLLEELDGAKSRFFANISHEFRTPLTVILGSTQDALAGRFDGDKEKLTEQHQTILRNTRQMQHLIEEVLDLNRLESGHLELRPLPGDVVRFLQRLVEAHAPLAERNGITLTFDSSVETCPRRYDAEKLEKIVGNLLSNALKFTPRGGEVRVNLHCGRMTEIVVIDSGFGIPAEAQSTVFERFAQLDEGTRQGGTGIGLALAKELAELHGGTIDLESIPDQGSTFTVRLPLEEVDVSEVTSSLIPHIEDLPIGGDGYGAPGRLPSKGTSEHDDDRTTILLIEDNDDVRAYVRRSLEERYRILEALDGEGGLQQARAELPDLIVSDVMLPRMSGYDVVRRLKSEAATECIPVIMLTARATDEDQAEGYGSGAEVYLTKPFSPESLQAAVARLLEERRRLRRRLRNGLKQEEEISSNGSTLSDRVRAIVLENLQDETFDVGELADALNLTRQTLYNRLHSEVGLSPSDFVRTLRLERGRHLLSNGVGSISEVAYAVGFNSLVAFSRAYRAHYGVPPSEHFIRDNTKAPKEQRDKAKDSGF